MIRLFVFLVFVVGGGLVALWRRRDARRRIDQLDRGERCMSCDGVKVRRDGDVIRCETCGHATPLSSLGAGGAVSDAEIRALQEPPRRGMLE